MRAQKRNFKSRDLVLTDSLKRTRELAMRIAKANKITRAQSGINKYYRFYDGSKNNFEHYVSGDKVLILRQYGGFGDAIILSCLLNEINKRYDCPIVYGCRETYMEFYNNVPFVSCIPFDLVHFGGTVTKECKIASKVTNLYDIIIDLTVPCHIWEELFFDPLVNKWRNRLDMWGNWCGLYDFESPSTCIKLMPEEINHANSYYIKRNSKPVAVVSLTSANIHKDFTAEAPMLINGLTDMGYQVLHVGDPSKLSKIKTVHAKTKREFLAIMAAAEIVVSVDSAALHAASVFGTRTYGLFSTNDGKAYCKYYPNTTPIQLCEKKCIWRYCTDTKAPCYPKGSARKILDVINGSSVC